MIRKCFSPTLVSLLTLILTGCADVDFTRDLTDLDNKNWSQHYSYRASKVSFQQSKLENNVIGLHFKIFDEHNNPITNIRSRDIDLFENEITVQHFDFDANVEKLPSIVDVVFVLDITKSMKEEIQRIKDHVSSLVGEIEASGAQARLCLVTFDDMVRKRCRRFVPDDPETETNENLENFKETVMNTSLKHGGDRRENALGALISAANNTPWSKQHSAQRLMILITDADFHDSDNESKKSAKRYPSYKKALHALKDQKITMVAIAPDLPGYKGDYEGQRALTAHYSGGHINFSWAQRRGMRNVFEYITDRINASYYVEYTVEENNDLDPNLPLKERDLKIQIEGLSDSAIQYTEKKSTHPLGKPKYIDRWPINSKSNILRILEVSIDGELTDAYEVNRGFIQFFEPPPPKSRVEIVYEDKPFMEYFNYEPYTFPWTAHKYESAVYLNNKLLVEGEDYLISKTRSHLTVGLNEEDFFDHRDNHNLRNARGFDLTVKIRELDPYLDEDNPDSENP